MLQDNYMFGWRARAKRRFGIFILVSWIHLLSADALISFNCVIKDIFNDNLFNKYGFQVCCPLLVQLVRMQEQLSHSKLPLQQKHPCVKNTNSVIKMFNLCHADTLNFFPYSWHACTFSSSKIITSWYINDMTSQFSRGSCHVNYDKFDFFWTCRWAIAWWSSMFFCVNLSYFCLMSLNVYRLLTTKPCNRHSPLAQWASWEASLVQCMWVSVEDKGNTCKLYPFTCSGRTWWLWGSSQGLQGQEYINK